MSEFAGRLMNRVEQLEADNERLRRELAEAREMLREIRERYILNKVFRPEDTLPARIDAFLAGDQQEGER